MKELQETKGTRLNEIDLKIIAARQIDVSLNQLSETDLKADIDLLVFKICAISGADLPATDFFANILSQQILNFLMGFGYHLFTIEEILTAFNFNAFGIKAPDGEFFDKIYFKGVLNVNLTATVLSNYLILRNNLDRRFQNELDGHV